MASLDFPSSPTNGQTYSSAGVTWTYNSTYSVWNVTSSGPVGYSGSQGYTGSKGDIGYSGSLGYTGSKGTDGVIGYNGSVGYTGSKGDIGYTGSLGYTGSGATGVNWTNKSATYTAVNTDGIIADTSGGSFTVTLPASPAAGSYVVFIDGGNSFQTYPLTVAGNGSTIDGSYTSAVLNITNAKVEFIYSGSTWEMATSTGTRGYTGSLGYTGSVGYTGSLGYSGSGATGVNWTNKSTTYTAVNNDGIIANTSGGSFTVTLPASPSTGSYVVFLDGNSSFATYPLTVDGNGGTIATSYTTTTLNITNSKVEFIYNGSTWEIATSTGTRGYSGSVGYTGSLGYTGSAGAGYTGSKGDIGYSGSLGYTGSKGDIGYTGSQGAIGYTGSQGYTGSKGDIGYTGSQGAIGYTGSLGYTGSKGDIGYTGSIPAAITATSLALGGATLGTNNLAVTGTSAFSSTVTHSGATTLSGALTYGGITLSNAVTGTGNMVLSASPTLTGTLTAAAANFSGNVSSATEFRLAQTYLRVATLGDAGGWTFGGGYNFAFNSGVGWKHDGTGALSGVAYTNTGSIGFFAAGSAVAGTAAAQVATFASNLLTLSQPLNYGGVTLSNSVTGTGSMVLSASPTFTGTVTAPTLNYNAVGTFNITNPADAGQVLLNAGTTSTYQSQIAIGGRGFATEGIQFSVRSAEAGRFGSDASFLVGTTTNAGAGKARIENGLGIGMTPSNVLDITQTQNAESKINLLNSSAGAGAVSGLWLQNGTHTALMRMNGASYTTSTVFRQDGMLLYSDGAGGITIDTGAVQPIYFGINNAEAARFDTSGNLMVGATSAYPTSPAARLTVAGNITTTWGDYFIGTTYQGGGYQLGIQAVTNARELRLETITGDSAGFITFYPGAGTTERARITADGLGIGGTPPSGVPLYVSSAGAYVQLNSTTGGYSNITGFDNGTQRWSIGQSAFGGANGLQFFTGTTERMRIDGSGQCGIGTTGSTSGLEICLEGGQAAGQYLYINSQNAGYGGTGVAGINCARGAGTAYALLQFRAAGTIQALVYANGNIVNVNNSYGVYSEREIKQDFSPARSQWNDVKALAKGMERYRLKMQVEQDEADAHFHLGLCTDTVKGISPGLVGIGPNGEEFLNTSVMYSKGFKATGEILNWVDDKAKPAIEKIIAENEALKASMADLTTRLAALEAK